MSAPPKLTAAQIEFAREISRKRRALYRAIKLMPTNAELAEQLGCSTRWLAEIIRGKVRVVVQPEHRAQTSSTRNIAGE